MHEYSIVEQLIEQLQHHLGHLGITRVEEIRLRKNSAFAEGPIHQAFAMLSPGTVLDGAHLCIEETLYKSTCPSCRQTHDVTTDDLLGHIFICPTCDTPQEIDEAHGLEILSITAEAQAEPIAVEMQAQHHH
ncbi:MAG: hydrogenase/urease maturation nickel metallochaperone HypA [Armatimonadota bacterium]